MPFRRGMLASVGFIIYIMLLDNWRFAVTKSLILLPAVVGQAVMRRRRRNADQGFTPVSRRSCPHSRVMMRFLPCRVSAK